MSIGLTCTFALAIFDSKPRGSPNDSLKELFLDSSAPFELAGKIVAGFNGELLTAKEVVESRVLPIVVVAVVAAAKVIKASALVAPQTSANLSADREANLLLDGFIFLNFY